MSSYYSIEDQYGTLITTGLTERPARQVAQRLADERGEAVYLYGTDDGDDEESEEILPRTVHCECGQATGERCAWVGDPIETVMVEWMPESLRESHVAAGNRGTYPHNGSLHLRMEASCAATIVEWDPEWTAIVESQMIAALHGVGGIRIFFRDVG